MESPEPNSGETLTVSPSSLPPDVPVPDFDGPKRRKRPDKSEPRRDHSDPNWPWAVSRKCICCELPAPTSIWREKEAEWGKSLGLKVNERDGCRKAPYVDTHIHLELVLQSLKRYETIPSLRKPKEEYSTKELAQWRVLGWIPTTDGFRVRSFDPEHDGVLRGDKDFADLTEDERVAATTLGWNAETWDGMGWPLPERVPWLSLTEEVRENLMILGECSVSWEAINQIGPRFEAIGAGTEGDGRLWEQLLPAEREAATELGFTVATWDESEMADVDAYIREFCGVGFEGCIAQGCDQVSVNHAEWLALNHPKVFVAFGCHPKNAWLYDDAFEKRLLEAFEKCGNKVVAWGEIGLDYSLPWWAEQDDYRATQIRVLERHLDIALEKQLPLVLHIRDQGSESGPAADDCLEVLRRKVPRDWKAHVHSCHNIKLIQTLLEEFPNFFVGLAGAITMENFGDEIAAVLPNTRLLLETDAPFLPPTGGVLNHAGQIPYLASLVAELKGISADTVLEHNRRNTRFVYGI